MIVLTLGLGLAQAGNVELNLEVGEHQHPIGVMEHVSNCTKQKFAFTNQDGEQTEVELQVNPKPDSEYFTVRVGIRVEGDDFVVAAQPVFILKNDEVGSLTTEHFTFTVSPALFQGTEMCYADLRRQRQQQGATEHVRRHRQSTRSRRNASRTPLKR